MVNLENVVGILRPHVSAKFNTVSKSLETPPPVGLVSDIKLFKKKIRDKIKEISESVNAGIDIDFESDGDSEKNDRDSEKNDRENERLWEELKDLRQQYKIKIDQYRSEYGSKKYKNNKTKRYKKRRPKHRKKKRKSKKI